MLKLLNKSPSLGSRHERRGNIYAGADDVSKLPFAGMCHAVMLVRFGRPTGNPVSYVQRSLSPPLLFPDVVAMRLLRSVFVSAFALTTLSVSVAQTVSETNPAPWKANPELVAKKQQSRNNQFNYVEANVPDYQLPDPLVASNGAKVADAQTWYQQRRPELMELFRTQVYGRRPSTPYKTQAKVVQTRDNVFGLGASGAQYTLTIETENGSHSFDFVLFVPQSKQPVPVVVQMNNRKFISLDEADKQPDGFWSVKRILEAGFATAAFHTSDVDPDRKDGYEQGIRALLDDPDSDEDSRWKALSAWGWGASRVLDHLETMPAIDAKRSAIVGHSRGGKSALWTAAEDTRFAIAYSNNSGCGGAALSRRAYGETVKRITSSFPHWFCNRFANFSDRESELPVDQHQLIALVAPRSVYVTSSDQDLWADPKGEYTSLINAAPVFKLLGLQAIEPSEMPALDAPRHQGATGYHVRSGAHNLTEQDWVSFLKFAKSRFKQER